MNAKPKGNWNQERFFLLHSFHLLLMVRRPNEKEEEDEEGES